ncbi:MAG: guanylate kinase [Desulfobacterales bacterium]|jgi:guanylate kinase
MTTGPANGRLFILSAPSGAGKTTLCRALRSRYPDLGYSISYTTRPPRSGERDGVDYHFISTARFEEGIQNARWAEWAQVHGHFYGTAADELQKAIERGTDVLLDIDVQGTRQLLTRFPDAVTVFIMPPSLEELRRRLEARGAESRSVIDRRLAAAEEEIRSRGLYRHVVVNDQLQKATDELLTLVGSYRGRKGTAGFAHRPIIDR